MDTSHSLVKNEIDWSWSIKYISNRRHGTDLEIEGVCSLLYCEEGVVDGAIEVAGGGRDGIAVPVVILVPDVMFDGCAFTVTGMPHIFDSVVLTGLSFDAGLLGLHIASFCAGVNDEVAFTWAWADIILPNSGSISINEARVLTIVKMPRNDHCFPPSIAYWSKNIVYKNHHVKTMFVSKN